ncbi:hypothetical protein G6F42_004490 [Rhizopus arrhizus]|nr:hypothetical protein G6F42_004490 [Rhizopus arrhizus]
MSFIIARQSIRLSTLQRPLRVSYSNGLFIKPTQQQSFIRTFTSGYVRYNQVPETKETTAVKQPTSRIGQFIQQSKELVVFYKNGIKLLWSNHKEAKALQLKVQQEDYELKRSEFQLIHRSKKDMIKLIPFGFVFCILPESIPLIVIYLPGMVPSTCLKDSQIQKQRQKLDTIRQKMTMNVLKSAEQVQGITSEDFLSLSKFQRIAKHYGYDFELSRIDRRHLSAYCRFMGLNDYGTQGILKRRLDKHMNYIKEDDKFLIREGIDNLDTKELSFAIEERGMRSLNETEDQMRRALKYWLATSEANETSTIPSGLLVFTPRTDRDRIEFEEKELSIPSQPQPQPPTTTSSNKRNYAFIQEFEEKIKESKKNVPPVQLRSPLVFNFKKRKNRHLEVDDVSVLSEMTIHTNTNYSRLDRLSDFDTMSIATQDLLPPEEEEGVFDVIERGSVKSDRMIQKETITTPILSKESQEIKDVRSDRFESPLWEEERISQGDEMVVRKDKEDMLIDQEPVKSIEQVNEEEGIYDDFMDDIHFGYGGVEDEEVEVNDVQTTMDDLNRPTRMTKRINLEDNFARKRIYEKTGQVGIKRKSIHHVKQLFTNKIAMNKRVPCNVSTFAMIADVFCDQLADDLLAYKENDEEKSDEITVDDMMLLMKRQRLLNDKTTLQSLIYKYLPREYWDDLIVSALADNVLSTERNNLNKE